MSQHNDVIVQSGALVSKTLMHLDRGYDFPVIEHLQAVGAQRQPRVGDRPTLDESSVVTVDTVESAVQAIAKAVPGETILLAPGTYRFGNAPVAVNRPGTDAQRITIRAEQPGSVVLQLHSREGFLVSAPYWTFENLVIRGDCAKDWQCEHAFHIVGNAHDFVLRNNDIRDFDAHLKINGDGGRFPDDGLIDGNTFANSTPRQTENPVTLIDLVAAGGWKIQRNFISDFIKAGSDRISYGAFVKGGGARNTFAQNLVICENRLRHLPGQRVGLSLGGGGTGAQYCRDRRCITEQNDSTIAANFILSCSDDGIYLNRAARSKVVDNTLIDTGGISVRFPESSADVAGNLVDGSIRSRDEGILRTDDNIDTSLAQLFVGMHPVRRLFDGGPDTDFRWTGTPPRRRWHAATATDLCGAARPQRPAYGAFEDFSACRR
ncbi:MAG: right-handed parallel beta-helix repeat-containing protein [Burkholderiaceae bacterium]